jgi:hypothetical protein
VLGLLSRDLRVPLVADMQDLSEHCSEMKGRRISVIVALLNL